MRRDSGIVVGELALLVLTEVGPICSAKGLSIGLSVAIEGLAAARCEDG